MFEEPYRWVEAIANRREYLDEQLKGASPVVALPCREGMFLLTLSAGTQKLYEIYDRIALGALGHPADIERFRNILLDAAHVEGFSRSPSDVTARRLIQFGLAPLVKQAFEEVGHAPFIIRLVLAELGADNRRTFLTLNYDGVFKEESPGALLAPSLEAYERMRSEMEKTADWASRPVNEALSSALRIWTVGEKPATETDNHLRLALKERSVEALLLSSSQSGSSKVSAVSEAEVLQAIRPWRAA